MKTWQYVGPPPLDMLVCLFIIDLVYKFWEGRIKNFFTIFLWNLTWVAFQDVALAMVSMRPSPLGPIMEKLSLSADKYGSGRRFYIQTLDDHALSPDVQEKLVRENPPEGVFKIKGSDHCPFLSKPQSLHKILVEIAQIP